MRKYSVFLKALCLVFCILPFQSIAQNLQDSVLKLIASPNKKATELTDTSFNGLLKRVDFYAEKFNDFSNQLNKGFDTVEVAELLPSIEARLKDSKVYSLSDRLLTLRSLSTFQDYFATSQKQLNNWDQQLTSYNNKLTKMQETICGLTTDTVFKFLPADSALRDRFFSRLNALGPKWHRLDSASNLAILKIGLLQSRVSASQLELIDFNEQINEGLKKLSSKTFEKEYPYLWDINFNNFFTELKVGLSKTIGFNLKILWYYLKYSYKVHIINLALFLLLYVWLSKSRNAILAKREDAVSVLDHALLTSKYPVLGALTVTLTLGSFFYYHPPIILSQLYLIALMLCVAVLIKQAYASYFYIWLAFIGFALIFCISNLFFEVFPAERLLFFLISSLLLLFSRWIHKNRKPAFFDESKSTRNYLIYIYFAFLAVGIIANLFGRYSLSKTTTIAATFTLVEAVCLILFVQIITEGIYLQMELGKIEVNRISSYLDFKNLKNKIGKLLKVLAVVLLLIFFAQNLNIFDEIFERSKEFFMQQREIGSTKFTFGGFSLFIIIIYLATVIAQIVSYFLEFADQHAPATSRKGKYSSTILLVRLAIWVVGFVIAIAASGVPIDKLTIILGALGVGIGFGLQSLVNNVVSGIVMVFEKPIQVGDLIEVGDKTGTVTSMGIRASKILTFEGSEVIVPNGDLLSQNLINWTLSNTHKRISLEVGVGYGTDIEKVKDIFKRILIANKEVMETPAPLILLDKFGDSSVNFKVLCWIRDIDNWSLIRSVLMSSVFEEFYKIGIEIPFPKRDVNLYIKENAVADNKTAPDEPLE
ncbi:mechanosensitive ion channel family protein [Pedobacter arcticus]|uniref:mechanosensitive ion channel family protein n=1 Tax=Pedobacter arcticus TaxID=752140 RepID=UPI0003170EF3|nr:mechanosensitive ion channel domain-containing protein [Pedobacter arcticus]